MGALDDLKMYGRFALGLKGFLRHRITLEDARRIIQQRFENREANFLRLVEKGIFGNPKSPYLPLMKMAGCELGDVRETVRGRGVEKTLWSLRENGVYFTFEEFKGRKPVVRNGKVVAVQPGDFDNPYLTAAYRGTSGGTTGAGTRVSTDLEHLANQAPYLMLALDAHGVLDAPKALWRGILPEPSGINNVLRTARFNRVPEKWFSHIIARDLNLHPKYQLATLATVAMGRLFGVRLPWPEGVRIDQAAVVARWAGRRLKTHGTCLILTQVSRALRVCLAAMQEGIDFAGVTFVLGGEPPTPAKMRTITDSGAKYFPLYTFSEAGRIGLGCCRPADCNDLHLLKDSVALIQVPRKVADTGLSVDAFNFTTLLPSTPKLLLNVEVDDYGIVEKRSCGCPLERCGYAEHVRQVRSFSKLTGEGVTLVGSEMVYILEEVLPQRFGGSPLDYQLLEEEDENGFTRLSLLVSPDIGDAAESEIIDTTLKALGRSSCAAEHARSVWQQAGSLQVKRKKPIWTAWGKLMPLHMVRQTHTKTG